MTSRANTPGGHGLAVTYTRVSSDRQDKEGFSIPAQIRLLKSYATDIHVVIVREFVEVETAKRAGRRAFNEMLKYLEANHRKYSPGDERRIDHVLVEKTDRLYRNMKDYVLFDELDLKLHFVKENQVLSKESSSSEQFIHGIKVLMARNTIQNLSEETKKGMAQKASEGLYPSYAPLGYLNVQQGNKRIIVPDENTRVLIAKVFEMYATGEYSLSDITEKMRAEGLVYRKGGRKVSKSTIHKMLTNPIYYGDFLWKGQLFEGSHEPIVTRDLWNQVQAVLDSRQNKKSGYRKHKWAFQGLISCGRCGCAMTAEIKKGRYIYYHCTGHKGKCGEPYVREQEIDRQYGLAVKNLEFDDEILEWVREALQESHRDEQTYHNEQIGFLQKEYQRFQDRIDAVYEDKLDGKIEDEMLDRLHEKYRKEQIEIRRSIELHEKANESYLYDGVRILELAKDAYRLYSEQDMGEKRRLLQIVFSNCTWADGKLTPTYRKPFDLLVKTNVVYQESVEAKGREQDFRPIWLPGQDSNLQHTG